MGFRVFKFQQNQKLLSIEKEKNQLNLLTAVFFQLFNFKMKIFPILGHLCIVSDLELDKFSFEVKQVKDKAVME